METFHCFEKMNSHFDNELNLLDIRMKKPRIKMIIIYIVILRDWKWIQELKKMKNQKLMIILKEKRKIYYIIACQTFWSFNNKKFYDFFESDLSSLSTLEKWIRFCLDFLQKNNFFIELEFMEVFLLNNLDICIKVK